MATEDRHFTHSTRREGIVEHVLVEDVLRTLWWIGVISWLGSDKRRSHSRFIAIIVRMHFRQVSQVGI